MLFFIIVVIPMLVSGIAVGIKRLHDRNKSGWWLLLFYLRADRAARRQFAVDRT